MGEPTHPAEAAASPGARARLADLEGPRVEPVGPAGNGFERFRLTL